MSRATSPTALHWMEIKGSVRSGGRPQVASSAAAAAPGPARGPGAPSLPCRSISPSPSSRICSAYILSSRGVSPPSFEGTSPQLQQWASWAAVAGDDELEAKIVKAVGKIVDEALAMHASQQIGHVARALEEALTQVCRLAKQIRK